MKAGNLTWFDLNSQDPDRARNFYRELLGWAFKEFEPGADLWVIEHEAGEVGGMICRKEDPSQPGFRPYFAVRSIESTLTLAQKLGARVTLPKTLISERIGWFALLEDPDQNPIALYEPSGRGREG